MVCLRWHDDRARLATGFGIAVGTVSAYTVAVIALLADRASDLSRSRCEAYSTTCRKAPSLALRRPQARGRR